MKIFFITHYVALYGANRSMLTLVCGLRDKHGHECMVAVPREGPLTDELKRSGIEYVIQDVPWWYARKEDRFANRSLLGKWRARAGWARREYRAARALKSLVEEKGIDLIHSNSAVIATGFLLSALTGKPHVWHLREYATLDYELVPIPGSSFIRRIMDRSEGIICVSTSVREHFKLKHRETVRAIYNGVVPLKEIGREERSEVERPFTFCIVGVVSPLKGQAEAIKALSIVLREVPAAVLRIIGEGALKEMETLARELGISDKVIIDGYVKDVPALLKNIDVLLMCSRNEAMGRVTAEAMCAGRPVIGFRSGGTAELIEHNVDGLLYSGTHEELAECMLRTIKDTTLYERLCENAVIKARKAFSTESYVDAVQELYARILVNMAMEVP